MGSPGYSIAAAMGKASEECVIEALGADLVELLRALDPSFSDLDALRGAAATLVDPSELLTSANVRRAVIRSLPRAKLSELALRLCINVAADPVASLMDAREGATATGERRAALLDFFGIEAGQASRDICPGETSLEPGYGLFKHQHRAAVEVGEMLAATPHKVMLHMPTGSGKTRTAMHVVARHMNAREGAVVCWLAQSRELLEQAAEEFERCWKQLGAQPVDLVRFWGDNTLPSRVEGSTFVVAGFAKLTALLARDPRAMLRLGDLTTLVVVDEAHQSVAPTYRDAIETLSTKRSRTQLLGLSATPGRTWADVSSDAELSAFFGERKVKLRVDGYPDPVTYLIEEGYLARPHFRTLNGAPGLELDQADLVDLRDGLDVPEAVLTRLADDQQRNLRILAEVQTLSKRHPRTIVFASTVAHARLLAAVLNARGVTAFAVDGQTPADHRERVIRRFRGADPRPMVMCNFGVLTTGFDAPRTSAAVIARPTRSLVLYSQMVGRATRGIKAKGNATAEIVTVVDPTLPGFGDMSEAFMNWEDVWNDAG